jgi:hypothetical protein
MSKKILDSEKLQFLFGDETFDKKEFADLVAPYFKDLSSVNRTNYLFVAKYGDGSKTDVTGYQTSTTINATINSRATRAERTGGKWAVYQLN